MPINTHKNLGVIEMRGNRIFLKHKTSYTSSEIDVTPLWHFFKEVQDYMKEPEVIGKSDELNKHLCKEYPHAHL